MMEKKVSVTYSDDGFEIKPGKGVTNNEAVMIATLAVAGVMLGAGITVNEATDAFRKSLVEIQKRMEDNADETGN